MEGHDNARRVQSRLSVLFYNCHLFGSSGGARLTSTLRKWRDGRPLIYKDRERAELIVQRVCDLATREVVDVAAFCEIWDDSLATLIRRRAASIFPESYRPSLSQSLDRAADALGSGLLILSRLPILRIGRTAFESECGDDAFSQKAYARVAVDSPGGRQIMIVWSHLQADDSESDRDARKKQINQLAGTLTRSRAKSRFRDMPVILVGDMNIAGEGQNGRPTSEYRDMIAALGMNDAYRLIYPETVTHPGYTSDPAGNSLLRLFHGADCPRRRIDYVLWTDPPDTVRVIDCGIEEFATVHLSDGSGHLSDHFAVRATFEV
jgi:endonuclease/exonuclease/phosphatase family metal-dependent hydrolase